MADISLTATTTEEIIPGLAPDFMEQFYDLRALAMTASALTLEVDNESDELGAVRRVLRCLGDKALQFADEADVFLLNNSVAQRVGGNSRA